MNVCSQVARRPEFLILPLIVALIGPRLNAMSALPEPDVVFYGHVTRSPPNTA